MKQRVTDEFSAQGAEKRRSPFLFFICGKIFAAAARGADATESEKMNFGGSDPPICKREGLVTSRKLAAPACKK